MTFDRGDIAYNRDHSSDGTQEHDCRVNDITAGEALAKNKFSVDSSLEFVFQVPEIDTLILTQADSPSTLTEINVRVDLLRVSAAKPSVAVRLYGEDFLLLLLL